MLPSTAIHQGRRRALLRSWMPLEKQEKPPTALQRATSHPFQPKKSNMKQNRPVRDGRVEL